MQKFILKSVVFGAMMSLVFSGTAAAQRLTGMQSSVDGEHYYAISENSAIVRYRFDSGMAIDTLFSTKWTADQDGAPTTIGRYTLSEDENLVMIPTDSEQIYRHSFRANNWVWDKSTRELSPLSGKGKQQVATFSPNGQKAAFVRGGNLFVVDLVGGNEQQITFDGEYNRVINGLCDWVYEEEYGFDRAYQWSTASDAIAYYRFDESHVKRYHMPVFGGQLYPDNLSFKYPKAGEPNSDLSIRVYNLTSGRHTELDAVNHRDNDGYFPLIQWTGRADELAIHKLNREQNHYQLYLYDTSLGAKTMVYSEQSPRYIDRIDRSKIQFLPAINRFVVLSERDGYRHLYLYDMTGRFLHQLTKGDWEVTSIDGIDTRQRKIYFTAAGRGPLGRELYSVSYAGRRTPATKMLESVTSKRGTYSALFSKGAKYYIQSYTDSDTPLIQTVHNAHTNLKLRELQNLSDQKQRAQEGGRVHRRFMTLLAADSTTLLNGYMLVPEDFDSTLTYPLLMSQYSGPGSQSVADRWSMGGWEYDLVRDGFIVACFDGRGTGFRGNEFRSCTYGDLGNLETQDQIAVAKQLRELEYIDNSNIAIYGWSYGGFMALNCILKGADVFTAAISVAPVTSWRYYDTIYTELYNGNPNTNPEGYDTNSPINFADQLEGKLLLIHGTADDNVHIQNAYEMISALNRAGKPFEMIIYPDCNHAMSQFYHDVHFKSRDFLKKNL